MSSLDRSSTTSFLDRSTTTNSGDHASEVIDISDEVEPFVPPTIAHILQMLQNETSRPVFLSLARLYPDLDIAQPPALIHEPDRLDLATSELLQEINHIFESWIALPCPSSAQITDLERQLRFIPNIEHASYTIQVSHSTRSLRLPIFFLNCYRTLSTLKRYCMAWSNAITWLNSSSRLDDRFSSLSLECMQRMTSVPLHQKHPAIPEFFSSELSLLLSSAWLTDAQLNAAGDYINSHPSRIPHLRVLHSHFLGSLALHFNPSRPWLPRRPRPIDRLLADGQITQLLIPVYQHRHWSFIFCDLASNTYVHTDTLHLESTRAPESCIGLLNWWLSSVLNRSITLTNAPRMFNITPQTDGHSCGVAVMTSMAHIALSSRFTPWAQDSTAGDRMDWFLRLLEDLTLSPILDEYPVFDVDFDDLIQPGFSPIAPFTCFNSEDGFQNAPLDFDTASSILAPSSPSLIDIDSDSDIEFLDDCSPSQASSPSASAFNMDLDATPEPLGTPSPHRASSHSGSSLTQSTLPFKSIPREDWIIQERTRWEDTREQRAIDAETERLRADRKKAKRKAYERIKKQAQRARRKALRAQLESRSNGSSIKIESNTDSPCATSSSIAETSRPHRAFTRTQRQQRKAFEKRGRKPTREATDASRVNWANPLIWPQIDATAQSVGYPWSATEIVHRLQQQNMSLFGPLRPQRISQWRDHSVTHKLQWKAQHLRHIEATELGDKASNRQPILSEYPHIVASIVAHLKELRDAGVPLSVARIRGYMVGVIKHEAPHLFDPTPSGTPGFTCSVSFVRKFLHSELGWSPRRATRAAQKLPADFDRLLLRAFLRMACLIRDEGIPPECIVNADQTQVVYCEGSQSSWAETGARQVSVVGTDEKRAFTLMVGVSPSGQALPLQAIYAGKTARSLPEKDAPYMDAARDRSFRFEFSGGTSYWANQRTMRSWVTDVLVPYFLEVIEKNSLPRTQRCILQIDVWAVHRSTEFRSWMAKTYPWIVIHYVPGGCTGQFQACDLLVNRALKIAIQQACHADIVEETTKALRSGVSPRDICLDTTLKTLRNRSVRWLVLAHDAINNTELIQKAFLLCAVPGTDLNLSHASLTSHEARQALLDLRRSDPAFYGEIALGRSTPVDDELDMEAELEDGPVDDDGELDITVQEFQTLAVAATSAAEVAELGKTSLQDDAVAMVASNDVGGKRLRSGRQL